MSLRLARHAAFLVLTALPAWAEDPMNAAEFEAFTTGKTLYYSHHGTEYGVERYLPGRRVQWSFLDGDCRDGSWHEDGDRICFVYEDGIETQCWRIFREGSGIRAEFANTDDAGSLYHARERDQPMICFGPDVGV